jgi:HAD superfamily hydrolase (TIGR01484 family)
MLPLAHWPLDARQRIRGVFTDIDDTLTTHGAITHDALQALHDLKAAGLAVIAITGRPVGWAEPKARAWPVDAMVVENGAVALTFPLLQANYQLSKRYQMPLETRHSNRLKMDAVAAQVLAALPQVQLSADHAGRETDLAFDHHEFAHLPPADIDAVVAMLQAAGMHTTVSSIHIHGCYGLFDKWRGATWIVRELWDRDLAAELDEWVFVGDSGNDQAMFEHFRHSVGVANIALAAPGMAHLPRYVATAERGAGFAQVARAVLAARAC